MNAEIYWTLPFVALLLCIALIPLFSPHFWEKHINKAGISLVLAIPVAVYLASSHPESLFHTFEEYLAFIAIAGSLYVIAGGIDLEGDLKATPLVNTTFLAIGSVLASLIGTTGASMVLIRAFLKTNQERKHTSHLPLFFIFIVSNMGGMLTPVGDPPLFLGFLRGVPFFWTLIHLFPIWALSNGLLLILFFLWDSAAYRRESPKDLRLDRANIEPLRLKGGFNFVLLLGVVAGVFLPTPVREAEMLCMALASLWLTPKKIRVTNGFNFHPLIEVSLLFAAIFITMVPALDLLKARAPELGITTPVHFYWFSGMLSSFLDNAPTYLTFFSLAQGLHLPGSDVVGITTPVLAAISAGSVMMGANTYIGNAPNFMVKAIADRTGIKTPSFIGYMIRSFLFLTPLYLIVTFLFFHD
ncbi:MAG: sodium:proton antiporter [Deltaproteobacteria bacterium]|nr:sodium:proton antiporter [Deltaproteobacteria bacterium]